MPRHYLIVDFDNTAKFHSKIEKYEPDAYIKEIEISPVLAEFANRNSGESMYQGVYGCTL